MVAEVKWIKVVTNMFNVNRKIKQIELMPDGDTILVIWLKLLLLAGDINDNGAIYITPEIPYTEEMLSNELRRPLTTVRMALSVFESFGMIEVENGVYYLSSWEKYQNTDKLAEIRENTRQRVAKCREKKKLQSGNVTGNATVTLRNAIEEEREEDKEKDKEFHSFILANTDNKKMELMGGELGQGYVLLSEEQTSDLLDQLSIDEFNKYVSIVAECERKGKRYKKKSHYQAILDMVAKDRGVVTNAN